MKFRLCGDLDVPDWVLKEISSLSKISAVKVRVVAGEIIKNLNGEELDFAKISTSVQDSNLDASETKAVVAVLTFILRNAVKYSISDENLSNELTQLGLPKEHSETISRVYSRNKESLKKTASEKSLRLTTLESFDWRIDYILSSNTLRDLNAPSVQLKLNTKTVNKNDVKLEEHSFEVDSSKFRAFLEELKSARSIMEGL